MLRTKVISMLAVLYCIGTIRSSYNPSGVMAVLRYGSTDNIFDAIRRDDYQTFLDNFEKINEREELSERTPLHVAVESNRTEYVTLLLKKGANIEAVDRGGLTPLHLAVLLNYFSDTMCSLLVSEGAHIEPRDKDRQTPLHFACFKGCEEAARFLIENGSDREAKDVKRRTPLHSASEFGRSGVCSLLLKKNSNVEAADFGGATPLHYAVAANRINPCKILIEGAANINAQDNSGKTPLMVGCERGLIDICRLLVSQSTLIKERRDHILGGSALHWACKFNRLEICKILVTSGFDVNSTAQSKSLLHRSCCNKFGELFTYFLETQQNPNTQDREENTPLHLACMDGNREFVQQLLEASNERKVDKNAKNVSLKTPLHCAVEKGYTELVELLLLHDVAPHERDRYDKTPLMYAAEMKNVKMCELLKMKISILEFNKSKRFLVSVVRGNPELENLFGFYDTAPSQKEPSLHVFQIDDDQLKVLHEEPQGEPQDFLPGYVSLNFDQESVFSSEQSIFDTIDQQSDLSFSDDEKSISLVGE